MYLLVSVSSEGSHSMCGEHLYLTTIDELHLIIGFNAEMVVQRKRETLMQFRKEQAEAARLRMPFEQWLDEEEYTEAALESLCSQTIQEMVFNLRRYGSYLLATSCVLYVDRAFLPAIHPLWWKDGHGWSRPGYVAMIGGYASDGSDVWPYQQRLESHRLFVHEEEQRTGLKRIQLVYTTSEVYRRSHPASMWGLPEETEKVALPEPVQVERPEVVHQDRELGTSASHGQERPYYERRTASFGGHNRHRKFR